MSSELINIFVLLRFKAWMGRSGRTAAVIGAAVIGVALIARGLITLL